MQIRRLNKTLWSKYKDQILDLEKACFPPELLFKDSEVKEMMMGKYSISILAIERGVVIGSAYVQKLSSLTQDDFDGYWNPESWEFDGNAYYFSSMAILPSHQGYGYATGLKRFMLDTLRKKGVRFVVGHEHDGSMTHINRKFGSAIIEDFPDWYGTGEMHHLYKIDLHSQHNAYTCGPYALWYWLWKTQGVYHSPYMLENELRTTKEDGTSHEAIRKYLRKIGIPFDERYSQLQRFMHPSLVNYRYAGDGHYGVIVNYEGVYARRTRKVHVYNPDTGDVDVTSEKIFRKNWYSIRYGRGWQIW